MKVLFNYAGQYNSQRDNNDDHDYDADAILVETPWARKPFDEVRTGVRWASYEITTAVIDGQINVYVKSSRRVTRQSSIRTWIGIFQEAGASETNILPSSVMEHPHIDDSSLGRNNGHAQSLANGQPLPCEQCV